MTPTWRRWRLPWAPSRASADRPKSAASATDELRADEPADTSPRPVAGVLDPEVAALLATDGFARIGQFLDTDECAHLVAAFDHVVDRLGRPLGDLWFPTILLPDAELRAYIYDTLGPVILPRLSSVLDADLLEPVRIDYSVKPPGPDSLLGPHQDFSIVDERRFSSLYLWIPLVDTDKVNGTLHVLPGSHRYTNRVRARHVPSLFDPVIPEIERDAVELDCRAGELILMVSGVVHFSPPNLTDRTRLAAHGIFKPNEAPLVFYFADDATPSHLVEAYEVAIDDYIELALGDRPGAGFEPSEHVDREPPEMTPERFSAGRRAVASSLRHQDD